MLNGGAKYRLAINTFLIAITLLHVINFLTANSLLLPAKMGGEDASVFINFGLGWLSGLIPYKDLYDHKGPLLWLINMAGYAIFDNEKGVFLVELLFAVSWALIVFFLFRRHIILGAACIFAAYSLILGNTFEGGNFTEEYSILFNAISLWTYFSTLGRQGRNFIYGLMGSCAFMLRPNLAAASLALFFLDAAKDFDFKSAFNACFWAFCGFLLASLPFALYFHSKDAFPAFLHFTVFENVAYSIRSVPVYYTDLLQHLTRNFWAWGMPLIFCLIFLDLKKYAYLKKSLFLWLFCFVCAMLSLRPYNHYLMGMTIPFIFTCVLLAKIPLSAYKKAFIEKFNFASGYKFAFLLFIGILVVGVYFIHSLKLHYRMFSEAKPQEYAEYFKNIGIRPDSKILNLGSHLASSIFYLTHRPPSEKNFFPAVGQWGRPEDNVYANLDKILKEKGYDFVLAPKGRDFGLPAKGFEKVGEFRDAEIYRRAGAK